jgi:hypothetical protein
MKFQINHSGRTLYNVMRHAGYSPAFSKSSTELVFQRPLTGGDFPKFHIYAMSAEGIAFLNLHLDQKKPSYKGTSAHGGEYDGPLLENEVSRIKQVTGS